jgi:hypothetical protein
MLLGNQELCSTQLKSIYFTVFYNYCNLTKLQKLSKQDFSMEYVTTKSGRYVADVRLLNSCPLTYEKLKVFRHISDYKKAVYSQRSEQVHREPVWQPTWSCKSSRGEFHCRVCHEF